MEAILEFVKAYGLPALIIGVIIIAIVGCLKPLVAKVTNKDLRKFIFYAVDVGLSFATVAIYYVIFKINFGTYVADAIKQFVAVIVLYAFYEQVGLRKIWQMFTGWLSSVLFKDPEKKMLELMSKMKVPQDKIDEVKNIVDNQQK